eukprot:TRINITY_DN2563_c0_g1_i1.p1 TRINITY_DN2563_c0_g1~~TRINITY_DN2563_c0_g1_i1.p1  ORF type:complete len:176 (-),score=61.19 TRINITY_DN2563_c0_g1_i1:659-1186(-)
MEEVSESDVLLKETEQLIVENEASGEAVLDAETQFLAPSIINQDSEELQEEQETQFDQDVIEDTRQLSEDITEEEEATEQLESENLTEENKEEKSHRLPLGRIKTIMKCDPELGLTSSESVFLITKATELFIGSLAEECHSYVKLSKKKTVTKADFDKALEHAAPLAFLEGTLEE